VKLIIPKAKKAWLHIYTRDIYAMKHNNMQRKNNKTTKVPVQQ